MMRGNAGRKLMQDSIDRAIRFRKEIKRLKGESEGWFFDVWQPENIETTECWKLDQTKIGTASRILMTTTCTLTPSKSLC